MALALAVTARPLESGVGWRLAFVALSVAGGFVIARWVRHGWNPTARTVFAVAVLARIFLIPLPPVLSDDGYRYIWDGVVQVEAGVSPYRLRPSAPELQAFHGEAIYGELNSPDYFSVYPPVSQAVFALGGLAYSAGWEASWLVIKLLTVGLEMVGVWCLIRVAGPSRAVLYAWHPLAVVEVAGQAHTEGLLVGFVGLTLLALHTRRVWAGFWLAFAGWVKLYPFALLPGVLQRAPWRGRALAAGAIGIGALPLLHAGAVANAGESLGLYAGTFDFYSAPYLVLKMAGYPLLGEGAGPAAAGLLAAVALMVLTTFVLVNDGSARAIVAVVCSGIATLTLTATTLHPWHWLGVLYVLPLLKYKAPILWVTTWAMATYIGYVCPPAFAIVMGVGWGGGLLILAWQNRDRALALVMQARARSKARRLLPYLNDLPPGARLLDLGCGEGYVGRDIATRLGIGLAGIDTVRFPRADPRVEVYDGGKLPYASGTFDATLLVFVLHHADSPDALLQEAIRVTSGPIVILETVHTPYMSKGRLEWLDRRLNRWRSEGRIREAALNIRSDSNWRDLFASRGIPVVASDFWSGLHPQALYVVPGRRSRSVPGVAVPASNQVAAP